MQFDSFNPEDNSLSVKAESLGMSWEANGAWLELTMLDWDASSSFVWSDLSSVYDDLYISKYLYSSGEAINNALSANRNYRVRVKALYQDVYNLKIKIFNADNLLGQQLTFLNFLRIKAIGSNRDSTQTIIAEMPRFSPLAGLFDYVIFSEEKLVK